MSTNRPGYSSQVSQAERTVSVQADCTLDEALAKMRERAELLDRTLEDIAAGVLSHRIWFR